MQAEEGRRRLLPSVCLLHSLPACTFSAATTCTPASPGGMNSHIISNSSC